MVLDEESRKKFGAVLERIEKKYGAPPQVKDNTRISEKLDTMNPSQIAKDKSSEKSKQDQKVKNSKQKVPIEEKRLEDLTFIQLRARHAAVKKRVEDLERMISNKANHEAKKAWDRRGRPGGRDPRKEGGEPILYFRKKLIADLKKSDQKQRAYAEGPGSGTFDEGFEAATVANYLLFQRICEKLPWEYVLELLREHVPEGEIREESDD